MKNVYLKKVRDSSKPAFINLFNLYHHDLAKFVPDLYTDVDDEGYYDRDCILEILNMPPEKVQPYIIRYEDKIAGLVILTFPPYVKQDCDYCILEIFVLNSHRGKGIALMACRELFNEFPGRYCIEVLKNNEGALGFWDNLIAREGRLITRVRNEKPLVIYEFEITED